MSRRREACDGGRAFSVFISGSRACWSRVRDEKLLRYGCSQVVGCKMRSRFATIVENLVAKQSVGVLSAHARIFPSSTTQRGPQERLHASSAVLAQNPTDKTEPHQAASGGDGSLVEHLSVWAPTCGAKC